MGCSLIFLVPMSTATLLEEFWTEYESKKQGKRQIDYYNEMNSPEAIKKIIRMGGGNTMGTFMEAYARKCFKSLTKRKSGKGQTGHDQVLKLAEKEILVEQKSSGHWGKDDYKWQHVEEKHHWKMLLLCGIDFMDIKFWVMDRVVFERLVGEGKITNQGNKINDSSEGVWFNYSDVKDSLVEITSDEELVEFAKLC